MAPSPYILRVLSKPTALDADTWQKWYSQEHLPDVVKARVATRGSLWTANNDFTLQTKTPAKSGKSDLHDVQLDHFNELPSDKKLLAVYQTDLEKPMESERLNDVPKTHELLNGRETMENAEWDIRVYKLIQNYDPDDLGDVISPYCLHVQNEPADDQDYHDFYEKEHLDLLHKVPGYRKSQRYQLSDRIVGAPEETPRFMVIHEFEHLDALDGPELRKADASPWVHKVFGSAKAVNVRGFKRVSSNGFNES